MYKIIPQERTLRAAGAVVIESEPIVGLVLQDEEEADEKPSEWTGLLFGNEQECSQNCLEKLATLPLRTGKNILM